MRKIVLGVLIALSGILVAPSVRAQILITDNAKEKVEDEFYVIDVNDIPQILRDAISTSFEGYMVKSVEVSNNSTYVKYKVVMVSRNGKLSKVYFDDRGNVIKEHAYFQ